MPTALELIKEQLSFNGKGVSKNKKDLLQGWIESFLHATLPDSSISKQEDLSSETQDLIQTSLPTIQTFLTGMMTKKKAEEILQWLQQHRHAENPRWGALNAGLLLICLTGTQDRYSRMKHRFGIDPDPAFQQALTRDPEIRKTLASIMLNTALNWDQDGTKTIDALQILMRSAEEDAAMDFSNALFDLKHFLKTGPFELRFATETYFSSDMTNRLLPLMATDHALKCFVRMRTKGLVDDEALDAEKLGQAFWIFGVFNNLVFTSQYGLYDPQEEDAQSFRFWHRRHAIDVVRTVKDFLSPEQQQKFFKAAFYDPRFANYQREQQNIGDTVSIGRVVFPVIEHVMLHLLNDPKASEKQIQSAYGIIKETLGSADNREQLMAKNIPMPWSKDKEAKFLDVYIDKIVRGGEERVKLLKEWHQMAPHYFDSVNALGANLAHYSFSRQEAQFFIDHHQELLFRQNRQGDLPDDGFGLFDLHRRLCAEQERLNSVAQSVRHGAEEKPDALGEQTEEASRKSAPRKRFH